MHLARGEKSLSARLNALNTLEGVTIIINSLETAGHRTDEAVKSLKCEY